ncbi:MFS transporter [Chryseobacterium caseinilyticum]|uniref:MFS transporter n=1 Tax=Chryseobacterium caseinilyticum TaxID=2771428 RepID=UPI001E36A471|nr:MFS transporter [Chryseobacterium caseinilyticum]
MISLIFIFLWIPDIEVKNNLNIREEFRFLRKTKIWIILAICAFGFGGLFAWLSYIAPLMTSISGFSSGSIAYVMILVGLGMVIGNFVGSALTDRFGDRKTIVIILASMAIILFSIYLFSSVKAISLACAFLCGAFSMAGAAPISLLIMNAAPESKMMGSAFIQSAVNIANSAGAYLGGIPLTLGFSYQYPALVGAILAFIGFLTTVSFYRKLHG